MWRACLVAIAVLGSSACSAGLSVGELDTAQSYWEAQRPDAHSWWIDAYVDGEYVGGGTYVDGRVERPDRGPDVPTVDDVFATMRDALARGAEVDASFDAATGHPTRVRTGSEFELDVKYFTPYDRPAGCPADPGSMLDLSAEPVPFLEWERSAGYRRVTDAAGCPVRLDVVSMWPGPQHCSMESVEVLATGDPVGTPSDDASLRLFVWNPDHVDVAITDPPADVTLEVGDMPLTAVDTGFRDGDAELWLDDSEPGFVYRVADGRAQRFVQTVIGCY